MMIETTNKRKPTLLDVALRAGVSKATAAQACRGAGRLSDETRERVLRIAEEIGFRPDPVAQRLSRGTREKVVPVFVDYFLADATGLGMLRSIQLGLHEQELESSLHFAAVRREHVSPDSQLKLIQRICSSRPIGLICNGYNLKPETLDELKSYQNDGGVLVCYDHSVDIDCDQVLLDVMNNTYKGTRYLLELGHRKIGLSTTDWPGPYGQRLKGFKKALNEYGVEVREEWLFGGVSGEPEEIGARHAHMYLQLPADVRPTAVCIIHDYAAHSFVLHAMRHGVRIPEDLSIVCYDDLPIAAHSFIPLTAVHHPKENVASRVVEMLIERWKGEYEGCGRTVPVTGDLTVRQSTAPPQML